MEKKRSRGVTILGWFLIVISSLFLIINIFVGRLIVRSPSLANFLTIRSYLLSLLVAVLVFSSGIGILKLRLWAIPALFLAACIDLAPWGYLNPPALSITLLKIVYNICIFYFLSRPKVKEQFINGTKAKKNIFILGILALSIISFFAIKISLFSTVSSFQKGEMSTLFKSRMYSMEGSKFYYKGQYEQAIKSYKKAIEIRPQDATANESLALCYAKLGRIKEAIDLLDYYLKYIEEKKPSLSYTDNKDIIRIKDLLADLKKEQLK